MGPYHHHELSSPCHRGINKIALKKNKMLGMNRDHHSRVLRPLGLVNGNRIGQDNFIQIGIIVDNLPAELLKKMESWTLASEQAAKMKKKKPKIREGLKLKKKQGHRQKLKREPKMRKKLRQR